MNIGELIDNLHALCVPRDTEVILRCDHEEDMGPCFAIKSASLDHAHDDGSVFVAIDGTQDE
jgi:hypothetical protein